jgi:hypothetical protein
MLINDLKGYSRLLNSIQMFRLKEMEFIHRRTEYSEERAKQLFILHCLNVKSFNNRYKDEDVQQDYTEKQFINVMLQGNEKYNTVEQVLKSLQFLKYQIEEYEFELNYKEVKAMDWLKSLIDDCKQYLLKKYTQYDVTEWGI